MPLSIDPEETVVVVLDSDKAKPEATRPGFRFKFLSVREFRRVRSIVEDAERLDEAGKRDEAQDKLVEAVAVGWRGAVNLPAVTSAESLIDALTPSELWELASYSAEVTLGELGRRRSESPPPTPPVASPETAAGDSADAGSAPPQ
jgi:hypothetical protein